MKKYLRVIIAFLISGDLHAQPLKEREGILLYQTIIFPPVQGIFIEKKLNVSKPISENLLRSNTPVDTGVLFLLFTLARQESYNTFFSEHALKFVNEEEMPAMDTIGSGIVSQEKLETYYAVPVKLYFRETEYFISPFLSMPFTKKIKWQGKTLLSTLMDKPGEWGKLIEMRKIVLPEDKRVSPH